MKLKMFFCALVVSMNLFADMLHEAVKNKDIVRMQQLINQGYDINAEDQGLCTEQDIDLYCQGFNISDDAIKQMVENIRASYKRKPNKKTALHYAAEMNFLEGIQLLLQTGADIESKDAFGRMPVKIAVQYNAVQAAEFLLQYYNSLHRPFYILKGLLHDAARANSPQVIKVLLQAGADVHTCAEPKPGVNIFTGTVYGTTPLHIAVEYNAYNAAIALLQAGASKYSKNRLGKTPVDLARDDKMKKVLKHFGAVKKKKS